MGDKESTDIVRLKSHISKSYMRRRAARAQASVNLLDSVLRSLERMDEMGTIEEKFRDTLASVQRGIERTLDEALQRLLERNRVIINRRIMDPTKAIKPLQLEQVKGLPEKWRAMHHWTYKGVLAHQGYFESTSGTHDWNLELISEMQKALEKEYDACFMELTKSCESFHGDVAESINARLHSLLADSPDLPEDVKGAVKRLMEELKLYLVSTGKASMLACERGVERLRRSFVDLLKQEVKKRDDADLRRGRYGDGGEGAERTDQTPERAVEQGFPEVAGQGDRQRGEQHPGGVRGRGKRKEQGEWEERRRLALAASHHHGRPCQVEACG